MEVGLGVQILHFFVTPVQFKIPKNAAVFDAGDTFSQAITFMLSI